MSIQLVAWAPNNKSFPNELKFCELWERPLMTSDFRLGRGVQNDSKIGRFRVEKGR